MFIIDCVFVTHTLDKGLNDSTRRVCVRNIAMKVQSGGWRVKNNTIVVQVLRTVQYNMYTML